VYSSDQPSRLDPASATDERGLLIGGVWQRRERTIDVRNPFDGEPVATITAGSAADASAAVGAAEASLAVDFPLHERHAFLNRLADRIEQTQDEYADLIAREGSKTIREARREPPRAAEIFRLAADEARRLAGETLPFDSRPGSENRVGYYSRVPIGVIAAITPFNDPLAMVAHKVGPALATGNAVVLKPASATPLSALRVADDATRLGLPAGRLNLITGSGEDVGDALISDPRVRMVTFTGGLSTGQQITRRAGVKKLCMELGSNSPVIVMPDANLDHALLSIVDGAFAQAGQNCLGVQRILVHEALYDGFTRELVKLTEALSVGRSTNVDIDVCSMISETQARRVESWIEEAVSAGARVLVGGKRDGAVVWPTLLADVPRGVRIDAEEVYGPVASIYSVSSLDEAIDVANGVDYGLHAAIFTESLTDAFAAAGRLDVGAVIVNDSTDYRLDAMPFGGTKSSGIGREGVRFACLEMTSPRVVCINLEQLV
jgi:glyceraldehyde-3-phosphate dehydrogenase (NADP+)